MSTLDTARSWTTAGTDQPVVMPRRHVVAIAILMCVPLPLFSLAATVVPLPQLVQRAAMSFASLAAPAFGRDGSLIREQANPVRSVRIISRSSERAASSVVEAASPARVRSTPARGAAARGGDTDVQVRVDPGSSSGVTPTKPAGTTGDTSGETAPAGSGEDPGSVDPLTAGGSPTGGKPGPGAHAEPPASPPARGGSGTGGGQAGGSGGSAGPGGSSSGGGGSGGGPGSGTGRKTSEPPSGAGTPPERGGTPQGAGNGDPPPGGADPGTNGAPPESPPGQGGVPGNGSGKP